MALFGFGKYNEKAFINNTAAFRDQLQRLIDDSVGMPGIGSALNKVLLALDKNEYPREADPKELQDIDNRIKNLFATMTTDLQQQSRAKLSAHAKARGESLNGFIKRAIGETLKRDNCEE